MADSETKATDVTPNNDPAVRNDNIGQLARRLCGDDERWGMMVSDRGEDGMADVMLLEEEGPYGDEVGGMPMTSNRFPSGFARMGGVRPARG